MAMNVRERGTVGCAYYVAREEKLYCMEDMKLGGVEAVQALKTFINPTTILIPYSVEETIIDLLDPDRNQVSADNASESMSCPSFQLQFLVIGEFRYQSARNRLMSLDLFRNTGCKTSLVVPGDITGVDMQNSGDLDLNSGSRLAAMLELGSSIDLESQLTIGCAGALVGYIQRRRNAAHVPGDVSIQSLFQIASVQTFSLKNTMYINTDTLVSLQIIQSESHPDAQNQGPRNSGAKEGLSLFGLFLPFAKTPQGKAFLRRYILRPSLELDVITQRHQTISTMLRPDNQSIMDEVVAHLKSVKNMRTVVINLRKGSNGGLMAQSGARGLSRSHWSTIREFLFRCLEIKKLFSGLVGVERLAMYDKAIRQVDGRALATLGRLITSTVDFEESSEQHRTVIKAGFDPQLDEMKRMYSGLESLLSHVAEHIARSIPLVYDAQLNVIFFPQIGFLIAVRLIPNTKRGVYEGNEDDEWEKMFTTNEYAYYKNANVKEMDEQFGDIYGQICDREIEIAQELTDQALKYDRLLVSASDILGDLDSLLALAQGAKEYNLCRPRMTERNVLEIKGGRHLMQERTVPVFVANDTVLVGGPGQTTEGTYVSNIGSSPQHSSTTAEGPSMLMVTGPNYSGKSVYLKQVALITVMAHIGSFVPADSATIGLTDKILTRIWTRESISRVQSAFAIDLQQMYLALDQATRRSLIIIDEFGKGTESYDGAGLAAGVFEHLLNRGVERPKVVAATHYHEIFENHHLDPTPHLSFVNMQVLLSEPTPSSPASPGVREQITYLYSLMPGRSSSSYGTVCAAMNGVPGPIVERAEQLIELATRGGDLVAACARLSEEEKEELKDAETIARRFLTFNFEEGGIRGELGRILGAVAEGA
ncbi:DNA mismatch repair protein MSH5 [Myriangium duriaei CBS 260.36]|uniref:DNA mismatch repair protein MSH5 n=1 Tax=Myriangium duriaei CBS 260.36 TaxID=1168546 RepID=A0A9P4MM26_9PEZI|nr:DNA mismatch repair protein MSH5 [Myriangium duriaei CBS 260.36]